MPPPSTHLLATGLGPLPNPLTVQDPNPPVQRHPATEADTRDPAPGHEMNMQRLTGVAGHVPMTDTPLPPAPPARQALAMFLPSRPPGQPTDNGTHAAIGNGATMPAGIALSGGDPARGNTFRLAPKPWDTPLFTAVQGSEGSVPE